MPPISLLKRLWMAYSVKYQYKIIRPLKALQYWALKVKTLKLTINWIKRLQYKNRGKVRLSSHLLITSKMGLPLWGSKPVDRARFSGPFRRPRRWGKISPWGGMMLHKEGAMAEKTLPLAPSTKIPWSTRSAACLFCHRKWSGPIPLGWDSSSSSLEALRGQPRAWTGPGNKVATGAIHVVMWATLGPPKTVCTAAFCASCNFEILFKGSPM